MLRLQINIGRYVMLREISKHRHKLQSEWKGPMRITEAKNDHDFLLEDINSPNTIAAPAQRLLKFPISNRALQAPVELKQQAAHFETAYHLVESIT